ncbi:hypothetical protein [Sphingopyxis sp. DBS4]|uniref:hypothetical protein n=1 Tax=Sphingopyxis sp. DBS4 TaxID=2968500 RepID=UPI00214C5E8B|nr:hypothetical protein [Sphingopyxis sp. DBS4]
MLLFAVWAICCIVAVLARRHLLWAVLCAAPLAIVSVGWLTRPAADPFGFYPWGAIGLFAGTALVIAATCVLSIVRTLMESPGSPETLPL